MGEMGPTQEKCKEPYPGAEVKLLSSMGDDLTIVNSARVSFNKQKDVLEEADKKLLNFLVREKHGTPLEMVEFTFHIKAPITVIRELQRHRISSFNEVSGRYVKMELESYIPNPTAIRRQEGKPGHYTFIPIDDSDIEAETIRLMTDAYERCYDAYESILDMGVAKELARHVLPLGLFSTVRYKTNARSLLNFLELRNSAQAMWEIRKIAEVVEKYFSQVLPYTHAAFVQNGRVAP